ncbi:MAG: GxxExxY protein [Bacteroidales bacterium]|nr:GxxExxY protein [Bacteroidales bacterium]
MNKIKLLKIMKDIDDLIKQVIGASYIVHNALGCGFLEKVYEKALAIELRKANIFFQEQFPIPVYYQDERIGDYFADLLVEVRLIVELKSVENVSSAHEKQLVNYLTATKIDDGLLINFGSSSVQVKRKFRVYRRTEYQNCQNKTYL